MIWSTFKQGTLYACEAETSTAEIRSVVKPARTELGQLFFRLLDKRNWSAYNIDVLVMTNRECPDSP